MIYMIFFLAFANLITIWILSRVMAYLEHLSKNQLELTKGHNQLRDDINLLSPLYVKDKGLDNRW